MRSTDLPDDATFVLVADRLADPGNAGTIIRSAEAAGRGWCRADSRLRRSVQSQRSSGPVPAHCSAFPSSRQRSNRCRRFRRLGTSSHRGDVYTDPVYHGRVAVVVGNEAHGLDDDAAIDQWITIPHAGPAESLNVAMAATVLLFEVARQRGTV